MCRDVACTRRITPHSTDHSIILFDTLYCREPSGIVFSTRRGTLLQQGHVAKTDLESITINQASGLLYVIDEKSGATLELDPHRLEVQRRFTIKTAPGYYDPAGYNNNRGFEAITFIANSAHPSGGSFFVASQGRSSDSDKDLARVYEIAVPTLSNTNADQSADQRAEQASYTLPGKNQEGITLDAEAMYISQKIPATLSSTHTVLLLNPEHPDAYLMQETAAHEHSGQ